MSKSTVNEETKTAIPLKVKMPTEETPAPVMYPVYGPRARAVAVAASTDETRFILQSVYFSESRMVATNGRILLYADVDTVEGGELPEGVTGEPLEDDTIIPTEALSSAWKGRKVSKSIAILGNPIISKNEIVSTDRSVSSKTEYKPIDGTYPNYKQVIPDISKEDTAQFTLSGIMLEDIAKACKALEPGKNSGAMVDFTIDKTVPSLTPLKIIIRSKAGDVYGVVMPCRKY